MFQGHDSIADMTKSPAASCEIPTIITESV